ncbi:Cysteine protease, C1A family [Candidatus Methanophagaceae archaeon]|nr:Cysteine protease, C1A family [Methanophagales archaeon]
MEPSQNNSLINNTLHHNQEDGAGILSCTDNCVLDNQIESNNGTGIVLNSSANILVENNYLKNTDKACDTGNNQSNITKTNSTNIIGGPCQDGRCGSDYAGNETGCDELGAAQHNITEDTTKAYLPLAEYQKIVRAEIRDSIQDKGANWTVGITSVSELSVEEKKMLFGAEIGEIPEDAVALSSSNNVSAGTSFDWRNKGGQNWVTPVESQGSCGSCWIFGATAAFETQINIDANDPTIDFDASEQKILSCLSGGWGCNGGWPSSALSHIKAEGVPDDACFPYQANDDLPCSNKCPDWQDRVWTFGQLGYPSAHTTEGYKYLVVIHGPMVVILNVYDDFCYYTGGVYEPVWSSDGFGDSANHCVMLVGYDDNCGSNGCWIIKNSWGSGWGMSGYAYVEYGDLEKYHYALVVMDTSGPVPETQTVELVNDTVESIGWSGSYWTENGLWHITTDRSNSPTHSWWYGQEATGDYDTGSANSGCLVSKPIDLTGAVDATLNFWTYWVTEDTGTTRDKKLVDISTDAGSTWEVLMQLHSDMQGDISVSLNDYVGEEVMIRFCFDTVDAANNDYEGWFVDDVKLEAEVLISTMSDLTITSKYEENVEGGFRVTYTIENIWGCDMGESNTGIYIDGEEVLVDSVPGLSAGASYTNTVGPFDCPCGSTVYVTVCADCNGAVVETDETNNCMENEWKCPKPVIEVHKTVRDLKTGEWEDVILANVSDVVRFKIWVHNSGGCCNLTDIVVNDTLSDGLEYADNASVNPNEVVTNADGTTTLYWSVTGPVGCCQDIITIEFDARKISGGKDRNSVNVSAWCNETDPQVQVFDEDCDYNRDGHDDGVLFRSGSWYIDTDRDQSADIRFTWGKAGDIPLFGGYNKPADLTVTEKFETPLGNSTFTVTYTVCNIGEEDAGASTTNIYIADVEVATDPVSALSAGEFYTNTVGPFDCPCGTTVSVKVCADDKEIVTESDEKNNCKESYVKCQECPAIAIEVHKTVWNTKTSEWADAIQANVSDVVRFRIWLNNSGDYNLTSIVANDTLSDGFEYADNATVTPDVINNNPNGTTTLYWNFAGPLEYSQSVTIEFDARKTRIGKGRNGVNVSGWCNETGPDVQVFDEDCAFVRGKTG